MHSDPVVVGATNGATITVDNGAYTLLDSLANLKAAVPGVLIGAASYTLSDASLKAADLSNETVATLALDQAAAVAAVHSDPVVVGATNGATITVDNGAYTLLDSLANLKAAVPGVLTGAASYTLSDGTGALGDLTVANAGVVDGAFNHTDYNYAINDSIAAANGLNFTTGFTGNTGVTLTGSAGDQVVVGSANADTLAGGAGADTLTGGAGVDTFVFAAGDSTLANMDTITDYRALGGNNAGALDLIDLTGVSAQVGDAASVVFDAESVFGPGITLAQILDNLASSNAANNGTYVFTKNVDTYIYVESAGGATNTYQAGDTVIKITGTPWATDGSVAVTNLGAGIVVGP